MPRTDTAARLAKVETLLAAIVAAAGVTVHEDGTFTMADTTAANEASQHYAAKDLPCTAAKPCTKTFRTASGQQWHAANVKH